jgi:Tol biopolymer transport system component
MDTRIRSRAALALVAMLAVVGGSSAAAPPSTVSAMPGVVGLIAWQRNDTDGSHIWTMHADGSAKRAIADGARPSWSPDGAKIVFESSGGIATMDPDGSHGTPVLDHGSAPSYSPDGTKIVFQSYDSGTSDWDIFVMNANGTDVTNITNHLSKDVDPRWSPDGTKIAFSSDRDDGFGEVWVMGANGSNPTNLTGKGHLGDEPDWSPDGTRIAYCGPSIIGVMNADGSGNGIQTGGPDRMPAWSPDGTRIVFTSHRDLNDELYVMTADGLGSPVRLTNDNAAGSTFPEDWYASWQPKAFTISHATIDFATGVVGTPTAAQAITLSTVAVPVAVTDATIGGPAATDFEVVSNGCAGAVVAAHAACTVSVRFNAKATGARSATLDFTGPAPLNTWSVPLTGFGHLFLWAAQKNAGPAYTWNYGQGLASTTSGSTTYLHAVYTTDRIGSSWAKDAGPYVGAYYIRSSNLGRTWIAPKRLNPTTQHGSRVSTASSGAYVYATWVSTRKWYAYSGSAPRVVYFRRNTSNGASSAWGPTVRLTSTTGRVDYPVLAASGAYVYVAYTDSVTGAVKVAISANRGTTWRTVTVGSTTLGNSSGHVGLPSIAAASSSVIVTWMSSSTHVVKARIGSSYGASWGATITLGSTTNWSPSAAASGTRLGVAWTTPTGVHLRVATAKVWGAERVLPPTDGYGTEVQYGPALTLLGSGGVGVAYTACIADCTATDPNVVTQSDLVWRQSLDGGATWAVSEVLATSTNGARRQNDVPSIVWKVTKRPFVLWCGWTESSNYYRLYVRAGL